MSFSSGYRDPVAYSRRFIRSHMPTIGGLDEVGLVATLLEGTNEFVASEDLSPEMVAAVCREGYLPMALRLPGLPLLLIRSHLHRYVMAFDDLHVPRNTPRYARGLTIYRDRHFPRTLAATIDYHPDEWIIPELRRTLETLHREPIAGVRTRSIEVYAGEEFVAGEVGYVVGPVYTSLSGFHLRNGAGTVQMVSLAGILIESDAPFWDTGMEAEYKSRLGARPIARVAFRERYRSATTTCGKGFPADPEEGRRCLPIVTGLRRKERAVATGE